MVTGVKHCKASCNEWHLLFQVIRRGPWHSLCPIFLRLLHLASELPEGTDSRDPGVQGSTARIKASGHLGSILIMQMACWGPWQWMKASLVRSCSKHLVSPRKAEALLAARRVQGTTGNRKKT